MSRRAPRQRSRQIALQVLYAMDSARAGRDTGTRKETIEETFESVADHFDLPEGARSFAAQLATGTTANLEGIDALIGRHARNWRISRMPAVDRNVLRLATYELLYTDTPDSVVIDQAIDLARRFGSDTSPPFVNGVLDAVARDRLPRSANSGAD
ncbi:transcription antitermination factor NusB [Myxococcota bacterium]|nr:transcription antitermination factor NusB [Myxococcota bacterium]